MDQTHVAMTVFVVVVLVTVLVRTVLVGVEAVTVTLIVVEPLCTVVGGGVLRKSASERRILVGPTYTV